MWGVCSETSDRMVQIVKLNRRGDSELGMCSLENSRLCEASSTVFTHFHGCLVAPGAVPSAWARGLQGSPLAQHETLVFRAKLCKAEKICA